MTSLRQELQSFVVIIISSIRLGEDDDSEECDSIFQTSHLMSHNFVK